MALEQAESKRWKEGPRNAKEEEKLRTQKLRGLKKAAEHDFVDDIQFKANVVVWVGGPRLAEDRVDLVEDGVGSHLLIQVKIWSK